MCGDVSASMCAEWIHWCVLLCICKSLCVLVCFAMVCPDTLKCIAWWVLFCDDLHRCTRHVQQTSRIVSYTDESRGQILTVYLVCLDTLKCIAWWVLFCIDLHTCTRHFQQTARIVSCMSNSKSWKVYVGLQITLSCGMLCLCVW